MFPSPLSTFLPSPGGRARGLALLLLGLAPFAFGLLALALGQDANWDLRNYHYYNAYAFLNDRYAIDLLPSQTPYFYNPLIDIPWFVLASLFSAKTVGFALGFVQGLNVVLLFGLAHMVLIVPNARHKVLFCALLALLGFLGGGGIAQIGTTFGDNMTSLGILLSAVLLVRFLGELSGNAWKRAMLLAFVCGIPSGLMVGLKLPAAIYALGLCGGLLFVGKRWFRGPCLAFAFGCGVVAGGGVTLGYWACFLQENFGSPLFPYFNDFFQSSLAPPVSARDMQFLPNALSDFLLMPFLFADDPLRVGEIAWRDWRVPILYILLPLAASARLLFGRNRAAVDASYRHYAGRYLLVAFSFSYVAWLLFFSIYRYAITLEMVAPLLIVLAMGMLPLRVETRRLLTAFVLVLVAASVQPGNWTRRDAWLERFVEVEIPPLGDTSNLMILMAGIEPYSHVLPAFPPEIAFVRVQSNFSSPEQDKGINTLIAQRLDAHRKNGGRFMVLIPEGQVPVAQKALASFDLKVLSTRCSFVVDRLLNDSKLSLCPVVSR